MIFAKIVFSSFLATLFAAVFVLFLVTASVLLVMCGVTSFPVIAVTVAAATAIFAFSLLRSARA